MTGSLQKELLLIGASLNGTVNDGALLKGIEVTSYSSSELAPLTLLAVNKYSLKVNNKS